ncbi:ATP-grasp domain-containing protein [Bacillus cereus group sp. MG11]|uniref:ATP-grasp domain-containing protein n=1 Tax=Bacillus cereus group sp. MG11 TaxID=3040248 RepID=UPI0033965D8C
MKWLVQEFLNYNPNTMRMLTALEKCSIEFLIVRVDKDNSLTVIDKETKIPRDDSDRILKDFICNEQVMVYGSKTLANIAKEMSLEPGSFMNDQFEFEVFQQVLGDELLNKDFIIGDLWELNPIDEEFFIRPTGNTKLFTGSTVTREEFLLWQKQECRGNSPYLGQKLMISPIQEIKAEYRFFVVNQNIVTSSCYKENNVMSMVPKPSDELLSYTMKMINKFPLAKAYVIDVAETNNGFKVVEYNNINTSGLYDCDEILLVQAINEMPN